MATNVSDITGNMDGNNIILFVGVSFVLVFIFALICCCCRTFSQRKQIIEAESAIIATEDEPETCISPVGDYVNSNPADYYYYGWASLEGNGQYVHQSVAHSSINFRNITAHVENEHIRPTSMVSRQNYRDYYAAYKEDISRGPLHTISGNLVTEDRVSTYHPNDDVASSSLLPIRTDAENKKPNPKQRRKSKNRLMSLTTSIRQYELDCSLVIAVDATPNMVGGYCINLPRNSCETYFLTKSQFPWELERPNDSSEFEMKNLMFALMLWQNDISKFQKFRIYTDNPAVNSSNKYGRAARELLDHCINCTSRNVELINENVYCNRNLEREDFVLFIQPADDLSRGRIERCESSIHNYYGIKLQNFKRSHKTPHQIHLEFLQNVNAAVARWKVPCIKCGYSYRLGELRFLWTSNWGL